MTEIPNLVKEIFCNLFQDPEDYPVHMDVQQQIIVQLRTKGFFVEREFPLYKIVMRNKNGAIKIQNGHLDVMASTSNIKIAIEYDSGFHVKYRSFSKLIQSNANYQFALIRGNTDKEIIPENILRFKELIWNLKPHLNPNIIQRLKEKHIWLGIARLQYFVDISSFLHIIYDQSKSFIDLQASIPKSPSSPNYVPLDSFSFNFNHKEKNIEPRVTTITSPSIQKNEVKEKSSLKTYSVELIREKYPNAYAKWDGKDDFLLKTKYQARVKIADLAQLFGRQPGAIRSRLHHLGLSM